MINLSMAEPDNMVRPRITVIGVGGGGGNAINNMIRSNLDGCEFVVGNTDAQALAQSLAGRKIQLGSNLSRGLGAGSKPDIGRQAAEESLPDILSVLEGSDMIFVTAGMGGGTGTGAAPVIARAARDCGILTVGVVTKPFHFEGAHRMRQAESGIAELQQYVDTLIVIPNQNLFRIANERTTFAEAFRMADEVLHSGVRGITDLMIMPGFMNLDFADVKTVMGEMGKAMMGTGEADGDNRAIRAAEAAISNPLLDDISMKGARGVLINITGGLDMTLFEVDQAANRIREEVDPDAQIKVGSTLGDGLDGRIRVSVIATGIDVEQTTKTRSVAERQTIVRPVEPSPAAMANKTMQQPVQQQTRAAAPQQVASVATIKPSITTVPQQPQPRTVVQQQETQVAAAPSAAPVAAASTQINVTAPYFTMPTSINPKMATTKTVGTPAPVSMAKDEPAAEVYEDEAAPQVRVLETQSHVEQAPAPVAPRYDTSSYASQRSTVATPPVREIPPPVQQAQRQKTAASSMRSDAAASDMRMTQLTSAPAQNQAPSAGSHINQRAQSLFQRITGFGLVRPSASREVEEELDMNDEPREVQVKATPEPTERSPLSSTESDLLDIPAFLRRQSNH